MTATKPRYLTKTRFKEGLECITKLYYTGKKDEYANQSLDDPFLKALAEGGFQVGELAKYLFSEDPIKEGITVDTFDYAEALKITGEKWKKPGTVVIAEAAFLLDNKFFVRADIVVKKGKRIDLYEVKAKSIDGEEDCHEDDFISYKDKPEECIASKWIPYFYDVAFQKYVISKCFPDHKVHAHLILADKASKATIDGLNQMFPFIRKGDRGQVVPREGLKASDLGEPILKIVELDLIVEKIWNKYDVPTSYVGMKFKDFVNFCYEIYSKDERVFAPIESSCSKCQFYAKPGKDVGKKDGRKECWKQAGKLSEEQLAQPLAYELWQGRVNENIAMGEILLENLQINPPKKKKKRDKTGMTQYDRRLMQVAKAKDKDDSFHLDKEGLAEEMKDWKWPLHMIDFETSMVALPFCRGTAPYQGTAFQFSHHIMHKDGRIEHADEYIHFEKGKFPNFDFVRSLKRSLSGDDGTIFRYHWHENTYLQMICRQLEAKQGDMDMKERKDLINFIYSITRFKDEELRTYICGKRDMVDLYNLAARFYFPPSAKGKVGLKFILPAIIKDSPFLQEKYGKKGIYGKTLPVKSKNFDDHQWIDPAKNNDPYKTLPSIFGRNDWDSVDSIIGDFDGIADGGAALTAYNYLQFSEVAEEDRKKLRDALLRYCELDTQAMVMVMEGWKAMF